MLRTGCRIEKKTRFEASNRRKDEAIVNAIEPDITPELAAAHGLKPDEYARISPSSPDAELHRTRYFLGHVNEHCSYNPRGFICAKLPTRRVVIQGPGETQAYRHWRWLACVFQDGKPQPPPFIEPFRAPATGVGGILRDVFTMGARPVACLNLLRFGAPEHPRTRHLSQASFAGSAPMAIVRSSDRRRIDEFRQKLRRKFWSMPWLLASPRQMRFSMPRASGVGNKVVYLGSKTGRCERHPWRPIGLCRFRRRRGGKASAVQVAILSPRNFCSKPASNLMQTAAVIAIPGHGRGGPHLLGRGNGRQGNLGIALDLDRVPCRETGMSAYEMLLSESQERMLMVLDPAKEREAEAIFRKWGLDFAVIGETTDTLRFTVTHRGKSKRICRIKELGDTAPLMIAAHPLAQQAPIDPASIAAPIPLAEALAHPSFLPSVHCDR